MNAASSRLASSKVLPRLRLNGNGGLLAVVTLATAGLFKLAAFAREAFIASRFGLSSFTDSYFAFQQFPLILATFMFGAFGLAFIPAYTREKRATGHVPWMPGLVVYSGALGLALTGVMVLGAPWWLRAFNLSLAGRSVATLAILSCSFAPVIWLGIWSGVVIADGRNLLALFVTGLPYLSMTLLLIGLFAAGKLDTLSLPISFLVGFGVIGVSTLPVLVSAEHPRHYSRAVFNCWTMPGFRSFLRQLTASSIENVGYSANQLLLIYFVARAGTGAVSANTCAMRIGMLGFSLLSQPLAQLLQSRLCVVGEVAQQNVFRKWLPTISAAVVAFAALLEVFRWPLTKAVYLHGNFSAIELGRVTEIVPAWLAYFVISSLNAMAARYLFTTSRGNSYVRRQLYAYGAANLIRFTLWGRLSASQVIWCSVFCEGCALLINLRSSLQSSEPAQGESLLTAAHRLEPKVVLHIPEPGSSASLYLEALATSLTAEHVPLRIVCPANLDCWPALQRNPLVDLHLCGVRATDPHVSFATKIAQNWRFILSSCRTLRKATFQGDIVHFQYILHLPFGLVFFACAWFRRAYIVLTVHDPVPHKFLLPSRLRSIEIGALGLAYKWSDLLVVHSDAGKQKLVSMFGVRHEKIRVVVHGPYLLKEKLRPCTESQRLEVLCFGSLRENKGAHLAIEAVQQLASEGIPIRLTISGRVLNRKEEEYWQHCRKLIDETSGAVRVFEAFLPDEELPALFSQCHCFLLPYTTFSSDSGVASMALANARPIVATGAGGLARILQDSGAGVRIPEASVAGVIMGLRKAIALGPDILHRMGQAGAQWMADECSWSVVGRDTRKLYTELVPQLGTSKVSGDSFSELIEQVGV